MWFKGLVAVACVAVIVFVGTSFWERYEESRSEQERASFESFCDLNYGVEADVIRGGRTMPAHIQEGTAQCRAAGIRPPQ